MWILLRGWAREQRHWGTFPAILEKKLNTQVRTMDLPGFGTEHLRESPTKMSAIVEDLRKRLINEGASFPLNGILGISLGGMVALEWLAQYPEDFEHTVVINASDARLSKPWERLLPSALTQLIAASFESNLIEREKKILKANTLLEGTALQKKSEEWASFLASAPVSLLNVGRQFLAAFHFKAKSSAKPSLLFINGAKDKLVDHRCSECLSIFYQAPLKTCSNGAHELAIDAPEWVADTVVEWIREQT